MFKEGEMQEGSWIKVKGIKAWRGGVEIMEEIHQPLGLLKVQTRGLKWVKGKFLFLKRRMLRGTVEGSALLGWYNGECSERKAGRRERWRACKSRGLK